MPVKFELICKDCPDHKITTCYCLALAGVRILAFCEECLKNICWLIDTMRIKPELICLN